MIRFGPAGIPLSCKGRTLKDGIEDVHNLSLTALEIQMVRANTAIEYPEDEWIGRTIGDIKEGLAVEILRDDETISDPRAKIEGDDQIVFMASGVTESFGDLPVIGRMAKRLDVSVSIHTPYYMDLGSNDDLTERCLDSIRHAGLILNALDGDIVVTHLGLYGGLDRDTIDGNIRMNVETLMDWWKDAGLRPKLGIEITGWQGVFGSLEQIIGLCDDIEGIVPVINFPHYHSRTNGSLQETSDFRNLLETVGPYCGDHMHTLFAGVERRDGNERRLTPIKRGDLKFEPLAEALADMRPDVTIISSSPLLEHDAMYMRVINERILSKRAAKAIKLKKKEEEAAAAGAAAEEK
jgi:deoxyribonuclease-4